MNILCVCNEKMRRSYMLQAIFNRICTINDMSLQYKNILVYLKKIDWLKNSVFLLVDNIRKIIAFK